MYNIFDAVLAHEKTGIPSDDSVEDMSSYFRKFVVNLTRKISF